MTRDHNNPGTVDPASQSYPAVVGGKASGPASSSVRSSDGEVQRRDMRPTPKAPSTGRGLPAEVRAGDQSEVKKIRPTRAGEVNPTREVDGGRGRPGGGLPANVYVK